MQFVKIVVHQQAVNVLNIGRGNMSLYVRTTKIDFVQT